MEVCRLYRVIQVTAVHCICCPVYIITSLYGGKEAVYCNTVMHAVQYIYTSLFVCRHCKNNISVTVLQVTLCVSGAL
jgi:hypothetical protein